ncbi:hypothetical protein IFM89_032484 [Coptis chinensis]|uniref:Uncharacterized protein n=1 Tax=Coptis chinensis TaxID=261450 RepID=A0A835M7X5_9MAGN|nr:hypothetical protein IFM89_032484 [Coptis chinensis]
MEEESMMMEEGESNKEVAPALIAIHPVEKSVVVAIGSELRVFDLHVFYKEMAKKTLALFVICIVVLAAMVHLGEVNASEERYKTCYNSCYGECKTSGKGHTACEIKCDEECDAKDTQGKHHL